MTSYRIYPLTRFGFGRVALYKEDGNARTMALPDASATLSTLATTVTVTGTMAPTETPDRFSAYGDPPSGTLAVTDSTDTAAMAGWSGAQTDPAISSWNYIWSRGNRLTTGQNANGNGLLSTNVIAGGITEDADFSTAFNGIEDDAAASNGPYFGGSPTAGVTALQWTFQSGAPLPGAQLLTGLSFSAPDYLTDQDWGTWIVYGSLDGDTWFGLKEFDLVITTNGFHDGVSHGATVTWDNIIPWNHYQMVWQSGGWAGGRLCAGILFQTSIVNALVDSHAAEVSGSANLSVETSGSPARSFQEYQDGLYAKSYPIAAPSGSGITVNGLQNGEYIQFDFGAAHSVAPFNFLINVDSPTNAALDYGTAQWSGSGDGTEFTNVGSTFDLNLNNQEDAPFAIDNPTREFYRFWRLNFVSTTQSQILGWAEIVFDLESVTGATLAATDTPDRASFSGYVGEIGAYGQLDTSDGTDICSMEGSTTAGTLVATGNPDVFSAYVLQPLTGTLTATENADVMTATGLGRGENGTLESTEGVDTAQIDGYIALNGTISTTENPDRALIIGGGVTIGVSRRRNFFVT